MKTWIWVGLLLVIGYALLQGSVTYHQPNYFAGTAASLSTTWEKFTDGKDMYPGIPTFTEAAPARIANCPGTTRARDGRCSEFLAP